MTRFVVEHLDSGQCVDTCTVDTDTPEQALTVVLLQDIDNGELTVIVNGCRAVWCQFGQDEEDYWVAYEPINIDAPVCICPQSGVQCESVRESCDTYCWLKC